MARPTFRVHLVTHHDGRLTGWLLPSSGAVREPPAGYGSTDEEVFHQLALALEEAEEGYSHFLWTDALQVRKVKVDVHPQTIVKKRHVIAKEKIALDIAYAWSKLETGGFRVLVPRFGWWFVLEDMEMAPDVIRQTVSNAMLGEQGKSLFEFRALSDERVVEWSPTLASKSDQRFRFTEHERFPTLHAVAEELVDAAKRRRRKPIVGELEIDAHLEYVLREQPRSILLVGPPGVGKSTWIRQLARVLSRLDRSEHPHVPRIWSTSADRIVSGMAYLGMWEQRCLDIADELSGEGDLLYVDHIMPLLASRTGHSSIADMFMPFLEAGDMALMAEASEAELEKLGSRHPGLANLFHVIKLRPTPTQTMPGLLAEYQARIDRRTAIEAEALRRLVQHLEFFQRDSGFPGKGFRFLDWLAQEHGDEALAAAAAQAGEGDEGVEEEPRRTVDAAAMSRAFARSSGLPLELISEDHVAGPELVAGRLRAGVIGQDDACATAARVLTRFKSGLNDPARPIGSLFFVGPTGVGKTELAKQIARYMFGDADRMVRLDMSEYMLPGSGQRMLAVGKGVRSLVEQVRQRPLSLVLLDEIEKAHAEVFDLLLAMLGEGRMTDTDGRLVDFRMTVVVMTSNLGVRTGGGVGFGSGEQSGRDLLGAVRQHFRPEFFNRIDHVVPFNALRPEDILRVVDLEIDKAQRRAGFERRALKLEVDTSAREALARLGYHPTRGARPLKRVIEERLVSVLGVQMAADPGLRERSVHVTADEARATTLEGRGELVLRVRE